MCKNCLIRFGIIDPILTLAEQGLDSLTAAELCHFLRESSTVVYSVNSGELLQWSGEDLVRVCCGLIPSIQAEQQIYSAEIAVELRNSIDLEPVMDFSHSHSGMVSLTSRFCIELIGISGLVFSIIAAAFPSIYMYERVSSIDSPLGMWQIGSSTDTTLWITIGLVLILYAPLFFVSFTVLWILQKWLLWGTFKAEFIPMHCGRYYVWWYVDRLTALWEYVVFSFIAGTPLVPFVYQLCGGWCVSIYSNISFPIRCPGLVSVGAFSTVDGILCPQIVLPHGVCMAPIIVGPNTSIESLAVVHRGCTLGQSMLLRPLSVVPAFTCCSGGYVWEGNVCSRRDIWLAESPGFCEWLVQRICRIMVLVSLPYGSVASIAVCNRLWYLIFPSQPLTSRIGNFWFNTWMFYGTGLCWSVLVLLVKWGYFGRAKEGPYYPGVLENSMRWALSYWNGLACSLLWVHFEFSLFHVWNRLLGVKISSAATVVNCCVTHPADADLVEVLPHGRLSDAVIIPYDDTTLHLRKKIVIGEAAEVGFRAVLHAGCEIESRAKVNACVFIKSNRIIKENHIASRTNEYPNWQISLQKTLESTVTFVRIMEAWSISSILVHFLEFTLQITAALNPWLIIWFSYYVYRSTHSTTTMVWLSAFIAVWTTILTSVIATASMHRVWKCFYSMKLTTTISKVCLMLFWRWIFQQCFLYRFAVNFFGGTVVLNLFFCLAGSNVDPTAKVFSIVLVDWSMHSIGAMAVINDNGKPLGHLMNNNELVYDSSEVAEFACMYPFAVLIIGHSIGAQGRLGSMIAEQKSYSAGKFYEGDNITELQHDTKLSYP